MQTIPIRKINLSSEEESFINQFSIVDIPSLFKNGDIVENTHRHNFFFILILDKGNGEHYIDFKQYSITDYAIFILRPGQVHSLNLKTNSTGFLIRFQSIFSNSHHQSTKQLIKRVSNTNHHIFNVNSFKNIKNIATKIHEEYQGKLPAYQESIKACLNLLFIEISRNNSINITNPSQLYEQERLEELLTLLELHISQEKKVFQYAKRLNLTSYQLNSITKKLLGKTASQLIKEQIILEAKRQLLASSNKINQVALHLGYDDPSYFIRFFKKETNYSPNMFRKKFK